MRKRAIKAYDFLGQSIDNEPTPKAKASPTNELMGKIIKHINETPFSYSLRVNSMGNYREDLGKWTYSGATVGASDIIAIHKGKIYCLEVKVGRDKQRDKQKKFQQKVEAAMGRYFLIETFEKFLYIWNEISK